MAKKNIEPKDPNRYAKIIEHIFSTKYKAGQTEIPFAKADIENAIIATGIVRPDNVPDGIYSFRNRTELPQSIKSKASKGSEWIIRGAGKGKYLFALVKTRILKPQENFAVTKIPDSTPGLISKYAFTDEQALLAKIRYNRLIDIFTGLTCYSLQNHLRASVKKVGQIEVDEIYIAINDRGVHYILPVEAKGERERLGSVQIENDYKLCKERFPELICRSIATQLIGNNVIVLFEIELDGDEFAVVAEKHYQLVPIGELSSEELELYKERFN